MDFGTTIPIFLTRSLLTISWALGNRFSANQLGIKPEDFNVVNDHHNAEGNHNPHNSYGYLKTNRLFEMLNKFLAD